MRNTISGTQKAEQLFSRPEGATMDEVIVATGGPQYNVLRRLEANGYNVRKTKQGRVTRYRVFPPEAPKYELTVSPRGQVVLPKDIRGRLGLKTGGKLEVEIDGDRIVLKRKTRSITELFGILHRPGMKTKSLEEIEEGIKKSVVERYRQSTEAKR
jgi:AbrB family looped-hinge helix DNA binding protein